MNSPHSRPNWDDLWGNPQNQGTALTNPDAANFLEGTQTESRTVEQTPTVSKLEEFFRGIWQGMGQMVGRLIVGVIIALLGLSWLFG